MPVLGTTQEAEILRRLHQMGAQSRRDAEGLTRQIGELQLLLRQTANELDRLAPRANQAAQRLRDMEAHIESYSRSDIKDLYATAHEAQMRLFMMQLQQEQIEHKLRALSSYHEVLNELVALSDRVVIEDGQEGAGSPPVDDIPAEASIARIIQAQEDERRRISRQIHDGPAQTMANLVLRAEICERLVDRDTGLVRRELAGLKKLVTDSLADTRHFIFELRPMILDDLGLAPTLRRYCQIMGERASISVRLSVIGGERRLGQAVEIALFRIAQEAIRNALKHGQPSDVHVTLEIESTSAKITVEDDGRGCDSAALLAAARQGQAMGLTRMEEYARSGHGEINFQGEPARGCRVTVTMPFGLN